MSYVETQVPVWARLFGIAMNPDHRTDGLYIGLWCQACGNRLGSFDAIDGEMLMASMALHASFAHDASEDLTIVRARIEPDGSATIDPR